jgi:two-component system sensor histidine kinase TctE
MMAQRPPDSLRRRLLLRLGGLVSLVLLLGAGVTFALARHFANSVFDQWLYDSASTLAAQINAADPAQLDLPRSAVEMFEFDAVDRVYYEVVTDDGRRIFGNASLPIPEQHAGMGLPHFYDASVLGRPTRVVTLRMVAPEGGVGSVTVQVAETTNKRDSLVIRILLYSLLPLLALLALGGGAIWYAVQSTMASLDEIAARLLGYRPGGPSSLPEPALAPAEIRPLLLALHELVAKLADAQAGQQRFIANASHQLRTPLATLQVQAERALREPDPVKHSAALQSVLKSLTRLRHLAHQLLMLARAEPVGNSALAMREVDLAALTRETLGHWTDRALAAHADLGYEGPAGGVRVEGEPRLLEELIGNLVDNAMRYGGPNARITVTVEGGAAPRLLVDDEGPGIPEGERALVLERFYRRAQGSGDGAGLGLPIAREIAARHGATLTIAAPPGGRGARVEVGFPPGAPGAAGAAR